MSKPNPRKERLEELLALARTYRGWTLRQLANELGRDYHNLVPEGGVPKLDLVLRLAEALDWPVQDVIEELCRPPSLRGERLPSAESAETTETRESSESWADLDRRAFAAHGEGRFPEMVTLARRQFLAARNGDERARACVRESNGYDGLGRYSLSMDSAQRGLAEPGRSGETTLTLKLNLANAHYLLGHIDEAQAIASVLIEAITEGEFEAQFLEGVLGYGYYVRGNCHRVLAEIDEVGRDRNARKAIKDLTIASSLLRGAAEKHRASMFAGIANTCEGGAIEMRTLIGEITPDAAMDRFLAALDDAIDPSRAPAGDALESLGWWCVFACSTALQHVTDSSRLEQLMGIFTNKADEIAERLGNWALRERVWTFELARRRAVESAASTSGEDGAGTNGSTSTPASRFGSPSREGSNGSRGTQTWVLDADDARTIAGAMGRFPAFRQTGWDVLRSSRLSEE